MEDRGAVPKQPATQLADAVASGAWLMDALSPLLAFAPQPGLDHPQPPGLASERYSINLTQLLAFETLLEALSALAFLVQIDGCEHWWFADRGPQCTLLVFIDDATGRLMTVVRSF